MEIDVLSRPAKYNKHENRCGIQTKRRAYLYNTDNKHGNRRVIQTKR